MSRYPSSPRARMRVRLACAALALVCAGALTACGPGGPKPKTADDGSGNGGNSGPSSGITLVAGSANATLYGSRDDKGSKASFHTPRGIVVDTGGNLFVADEENRVIRKITPDGTVSTFAGTAGAQGSANGNGNRARFTDPTALAIDAGNNLFVLDGYLIRKITPAGDVTTPVTLPNNGNSQQFQPAGITIDASGTLFLTTGVDTRRLSGAQYQFSSLLEGPIDATGLATGVLAPRGVAVDANGVAYVADLTHTISSIAADSTRLIRFAGAQNSQGHRDGNANTAQFRQVVALTTAKDGTLYAADAQSNTIRKIATNGETSTLAGRDGNTTLVTGGLPGSLANVAGIAVDANGYLYVTTGNAVVKIVP